VQVAGRRRGGPALPTVGFVAVGASSALLLAGGPRLLPTAAFSGLALAWTLTSLFGVGVATPTEQLATRRGNAPGTGEVRTPLAVLALLGAAAAALAALAAPRLDPHATFPALGWSAALGILAWVALAATRSRLAGAGDLVAYAGVLGVEAVVRVALVAAAVADRAHAAALLAAAVGVPILASAASGWLVALAGGTAPAAGPGTAPGATAGDPDAGPGAPAVLIREQPAFVASSVGYQLCLSGAALLLAARAGAHEPAVVGAFVAASTYFRAPTLLTGGVTTHALVELSHARGRGDTSAFRAGLRAALRAGGTIVVGVSAALVVAAPLALPLYYGHPLRLPVVVLGALAVSTVVGVLASVLTQPLLAARRGGVAALAWCAGAAVTAVGVLADPGVGRLTAAGLLAGPLVALVVQGGAVRHLVAQPGRGAPS